MIPNFVAWVCISCGSVHEGDFLYLFFIEKWERGVIWVFVCLFFKMNIRDVVVGVGVYFRLL